MDKKTFEILEPGDLIKPMIGHRVFVVTGNYGTHVTATTTVDMTSPSQWKLVRKAHTPRGKFGIVVVEKAMREDHWTHSVKPTLEEAELVRRELREEYPDAIIEVHDWSDVGSFPPPRP